MPSPTTAQSVIGVVRKALTSGKDASKIVRRYVTASDEGFEYDEDFRLEVCRGCAALLESEELHAQLLASLTDAISTGIGGLSCAMLIYIGNDIIQHLKDDKFDTGRFFDLLPRLLSEMAAGEAADPSPEAQCCSVFLNKLCNVAWPARCVLKLADALKAVQATPSQLTLIVKKLLRSLGEIPLDEVPLLAYHLFVIADKTHYQLVVSSLIKLFQNLGAISSQEAHDAAAGEAICYKPSVLNAQAALLVHFSLASKQDQAIGVHLAKYLKTCPSFTPLTLGLSLTTSRIPRFQDQIFQLLRAQLLEMQGATSLSTASPWLMPFVPESLAATTVVKQVASFTCRGWDMVLEPLVAFGLYLLDEPKDVKEIASTGSLILEQLWLTRPEVRPSLLTEVWLRIPTATAHVSSFIQLLKRMLATAGLNWEEFTESTLTILDQLSALDPAVSEPVIKALHPALTHSEPIKTAALIAFRKGLFNRSFEGRFAAVTGLLALVQCHRDDTVLCQEILGNFRRCFSQQLEVKQALYRGIMRIMSEVDSEAVVLEILELLHSQLLRFAKPAQQPPFQLGQLFKSDAAVTPFEDLGLLLAATSRVPYTHPESELCSAVIAECTRLAELVAEADLEHFDLDKESDFSLSSLPSRRNNATAKVLLSVYDACISVLAQAPLTLQTAQWLAALARKRQYLLRLLQAMDRKSSITVNLDVDTCFTVSKEILPLTMPDPGVHAILAGKPTLLRLVLDAMSTADIESFSLEQQQLAAAVCLYPLVSPTEFEQLDKNWKAKKDKSESVSHALMAMVHTIISSTTWGVEVLTNYLAQHQSHGTLCSLLQTQFQQNHAAKDALVFLRCLKHLQSKPPFRQDLASWARSMCSSLGAQSSEACKLLLMMASDGDKPLKFVNQLIMDLERRLGSVEDSQPRTEPFNFSIVSQALCVSGVAPSCAVAAIDKILDAIDWLSRRLVMSQKAPLDEVNVHATEKLCNKLTHVANTTAALLQVYFEKPAAWTAAFRLVRRVFHAVTQYAKFRVAELKKNRDVLPLGEARLFKLCCTRLSPNVYAAINIVNQDVGLHSKRGFDAKVVPHLIYDTEVFDRYIMLLSKHSTTNLEKHLKRRTARDFRISVQGVQQAIEDAMDEDAAEEQEHEGTPTGNTSPEQVQEQNATRAKIISSVKP
eukprot:m.343097 g.343097  ORF g.343097 m.343097 type:complete len:1167 (-) comp16128_c2_seq7:8433-11933(-)